MKSHKIVTIDALFLMQTAELNLFEVCRCFVQSIGGCDGVTISKLCFLHTNRTASAVRLVDAVSVGGTDSDISFSHITFYMYQLQC